MKKFLKRFFIGLGILILLLVAAIIATPFLFKDKINARVKEEINKQLNAKVDYGDFSLSLFRSFPNFSFGLSNFSITGIDSFKGDTLVAIKQVDLTLDLMSVIKGDKYKLVALIVDEPTVNALVNYEGKANWDIAKPSADKPGSEKSSFALEIKKTQIEKGNVVYDDKKGGTYAEVRNLNFEASGDVTQDLFDFITKTTIEQLTVKSGGIAYLSKAKLDAGINLTIDNKNNKYTFKENTLNLNELGLQFSGFVAMPANNTNLDVTFKSKQTEFKSILSLIPAVYAKDFSKIKTSGSLALDGTVKGNYAGENYPAITLNLNVTNGMFQYPDLPVAVRNIALLAKVNKPQGVLDLMVIDIPKLHLEAGTDPVDASINVKTPVSDPDVKANIAGKMNLANVPKFYPMEGLKTMSGLLNMNLQFKGRMSDVERKNYQAIQAAGSAQITNLVYDSKDVPMAVKVPDMQMQFSPQNVTLKNLQATIGKSDVNATGTLDNFMGYFFGKGNLLGTLNLRCTTFDANEWLQKDKDNPQPSTAMTGGAKAPDTATTQFFKVPAHIDFTANSQFGRILFDKLVLSNVKGQVTIKDEAINLNNLFANVLGGDATISARYNTRNLDYPDVTFNYDINNFDIQQTYRAVGMAEKIAPVIKHIEGNFSSDLKGSGRLNPDMSVDYSSLKGDGKVEIPSAKIVGLPVLAEITKVAKIPALQNLEMKNAFTVLQFKDGKVNVDPTDIKFGNGYNINFKGANGFDQSIDYDVRFDIPSKELGPATTLAQSMLAKVPGINAAAALPETVGFLFKVTGTATKPQVKLSKVLAGKGSVKDIVKDTAEDLKKKAEEEAKAKAEELKKKAEEELNKKKQEAEQKAREAAEKARKEAEQKAKEAAEKAKKEAEQKLKDKLKWPK